jgi:hypothetical protein
MINRASLILSRRWSSHAAGRRSPTASLKMEVCILSRIRTCATFVRLSSLMHCTGQGRTHLHRHPLPSRPDLRQMAHGWRPGQIHGPGVMSPMPPAHACPRVATVLQRVPRAYRTPIPPPPILPRELQYLIEGAAPEPAKSTGAHLSFLLGSVLVCSGNVTRPARMYYSDATRRTICASVRNKSFWRGACAVPPPPPVPDNCWLFRLHNLAS